MFQAVCERFAPVMHITENCPAETIEADVILFWDIHSSHHIEIKGIEKHSAIKLEYFNDPHQVEQVGRYKTGQKFHKLSARQRCERAKSRGVQYIICPYKNGYDKYIAPYMGYSPLIWIPVSPKNRIDNPMPLTLRQKQVSGTGHLWQGTDEFKPYEFRNWAYEQKTILHLSHSINCDTPRGPYFQKFLSGFAASLALCDSYVVPKYIEIPLAGCLCFCQMHDEYEEMGFKDGINCVAVTKENFNERIADFLSDIGKYQPIADAGRMQALNYTADKFADKLYEYLNELI
jgi:hypothetical protein